jgi:hypothetical protein
MILKIHAYSSCYMKKEECFKKGSIKKKITLKNKQGGIK